MALLICTWLWGDKYDINYVRKLSNGLKRAVKQDYNFLVCAPDPRYLYLTQGCLIRLQMFDPEWQRMQNIKEGDRVVCMDLDVIAIKDLDECFNRPEPFLILQGANSSNPCPYNGSIWSFEAGYRPDIWHSFSMEAIQHVKFDKFPDDQAWFAAKLPKAVGWIAGKQSGIYAFHKPGWPEGSNDLPQDAKLVVFPGYRDPSKFKHLDWVKEYWQ